MSKNHLKTGIIGTIIMALCCFTPILVWIFAAIGLSGLIIYLDLVLLPLLAFFMILTGVALWRRHKST